MRTLHKGFKNIFPILSMLPAVCLGQIYFEAAANPVDPNRLALAECRAGQFLNARAMQQAPGQVQAIPTETDVNTTGIRCIDATDFADSERSVFLFTGTGTSLTVIVVSDNDVAEIAGFTDSPAESIDRMPPALIASLRVASIRDGETPGNGRGNVSPLVSTKWHQVEPYNNLMPTIGGEHALVGCVPTSMAQVMKYYSWPESGIGSATLSDFNITADFENTIYRWDLMPNMLTINSPQEQIKAVGTLMLHCGVAAQAKLGVSATGADVYKALKALRNHFGYRGDLISHNYYSLSGWNQLIYEELAAGRPVMYTGLNSAFKNGHSFICDGYADGYFHMNWGWGGDYDGYFKLSVLQPSDDNDFSYKPTPIVGLEPDLDSTAPALYPFLLAFSPTTSNSSMSLTLPFPKCYYAGGGSFDMEYGLSLVDPDSGEQTGVKSVSIKSGVESSPNVEYGNVQISGDKFTENGEFLIYPVARVAGRDVWQRVPVRDGADHAVLTVTDGRLTVTPGEEDEASIISASFKQDLIAFAGREFSIIFTLQATGCKTWPVSLKYRHDGVETELCSFNVETEGVETVSVTRNITLQDEGKYEFFAYIEDAGEVGNTEIEVLSYGQPEYQYYKLPYVENLSGEGNKEFRLHIPLQCNSGIFSEKLRISIDADNGYYNGFELGTLQLQAGEKIDFQYDFSIDGEEGDYRGWIYHWAGGGVELLTNSRNDFFTFVKHSGVEDLPLQGIRVSGETLLNPEEEEIRIHDISGRLLYAGRDREISLPARGVFIVTANGRARKAIVR